MALINVYYFFRLCCSLQLTEPRFPPAALSTALASFSLCSFNRPAKSGPDISVKIFHRLTTISGDTFAKVCKVIGHFCEDSCQRNITSSLTMDCLQGMDNILHYLCLLWQANKCFGISPCFHSSAGSADGQGGKSGQVVHLYNYTDLVWS